MSDSTAELERFLSGFELLRHATPGELAKLATRGATRRFNPGEAVIRQGDFGSSMFFIVSGAVTAKMRGFDRHEAVLRTLHSGQSFGELGLAGDRPRSATVEASEASVLFEVSREIFAAALGRNDAVSKTLDRTYRRMAVSDNLYSDPLFSELPAETIARLVDRAHMRAYEKEDVVFEEGEPGDAFYIIWSGHVRIVKRDPQGGERVFAYVAAGDYFGETALLERRPRTATVIANDRVELIEIGREEFDQVLVSHLPLVQRLRERISARAGQAQQVLASGTRQFFIADMLKLGAAYASKALVINLDLCTRCGACAAACHDLYGNSRLTRRGKTFELPDSGETILMPNSCWHCRDPECMIGCPTDALRRGPGGEIEVLQDRCIGCEICANRCPWGNITMADPAPVIDARWWTRAIRRLLGRGGPRVAAVAGSGLAREGAKAIKCDLCQTRSSQACVNACGYGAIAVVDPNAYLRQAMES